jgi:transcriptional regulator with XRE-family HTH domain
VSPLFIPPRWVHGDFAGWLSEAMSSRGLSARVVAMRTGINHSTVTRLALGERQPTLATAVALLQLFSVPRKEPAPRIGKRRPGSPSEILPL